MWGVYLLAGDIGPHRWISVVILTGSCSREREREEINRRPEREREREWEQGTDYFGPGL